MPSRNDPPAGEVVEEVDEAVLHGQVVSRPEYAELGIERANWYQTQLRRGKSLASVPAIPGIVGLIIALLGNHNASLIAVSGLGIVAGLLGFATFERKERRVRRAKAMNERLHRSQ